AVAQLEASWGLDRPFVVQYASWLGRVLSGDLGRSWYSDSPVAEIMVQRAPITLSVALLALAIGMAAGTLLGTLSAVRAGSWLDRVITAVLSAASTLPAFVIGIGLIAIFSVALPIFPAAGYLPLKFGWWPWLSTILLPALALSFDTAADLGRQLRASMIEAYGRNYVLGARARGYGELRIFVRHVLPNALGPAVAILGLKFPALLGGAVVTESIFNMNGYGKFAADSSLRGDVPAVQAVLVVAVGLVLVFSVLVNLVQIRLNPASGRGY
ncbi:MAG: ABC transporter permease, partial [Bordetella sp.]|nr:ABC transporter permease [Bordetella sp.]